MVKNKEQFVERARELHGDRYDYDRFVYTKSREKSYITCKIHGDFLMCANHHIDENRMCGCQQCSLISGGQKKTQSSHLNVLNRANKIHGNKYDLSKIEFKRAKDFITVECPMHGEFTILQDLFTRKSGCPKCSRIKLSENATGFNEEFYLRRYRKYGTKPYMYILCMYDDNECFIKLGITYDLDSRYKTCKLPYEYKVLGTINLNPENVMAVEKFIKRGVKQHFPEYKYKPLKRFGGHTECYTLEFMEFAINSAKLKLEKIINGEDF